jgi:hypothetical protein
VPKPKKPQEVVSILRRHDGRFVIYEDRGKGSHRMIYHPDVAGRPQSFPLTFGFYVLTYNATDEKARILKGVAAKFGLPPDFLKVDVVE